MTVLFKLLGNVPLRWWLYVAAAAAVAGVLWHDHHQTHRANELAVEKRALEQRLASAEENARRKEAASNAYQKRLAALRGARGDTPVRPVQLCVSARPRLPSTPVGHDAAGPGELPDPPGRDTQVWLAAGRDIGPALYELADEADQCAAQRDALIEWVRNQ